MHRRRLLLVLLVVLAASVAWLGAVGRVRADGGPYYWECINVDITIRPSGDLEIIEAQRYVFGQGIFSYAFREIPLDRVESIDEVWVEENGRRLPPGQVEVRNTARSLRITWYFPPAWNETRAFRIHYVAHGALRIYEEGDQLWWKAVFADRDYPVRSSWAMVHLPAAVDPASLKLASYGARAQYRVTNDRTVVFNAGQIKAGQELEVRVQFPHGLVSATPPAWQEEADQQAAYDAQMRPAVNLLVGAFSLFLLVIGGLGMLALWYLRGREELQGIVASWLSEPPTDLAPGLVGVLVDGKADLRDIVATIVDLARRGVLEMQELPIGAPGRPAIGYDYTFRLLPGSPELRRYESTILGWFFTTGRERRLSDLRDRLGKAVPEIHSQMYEEVMQAELFVTHPEGVRLGYAWLGGGLAVLAALAAVLGSGLLNGELGMTLLFAAASILGKVGWVVAEAIHGLAVEFSRALGAYTDVGILPFIALAGIGVMIAVAGSLMTRRTAKGAREAALWRAFRRYMAEVDKYADLARAKELFDRYLPYAIAFGLAEGWIDKFAAVDVPAPGWYLPFLPAAGAAAVGLGLAGPGTGVPSPMEASSLQAMSDGLGRSLSSMSGGLVSMLNSASAVLGSAPPPTVSGRGADSGWSAGWSGGGGRGGGGGGGGSGGAG